LPKGAWHLWATFLKEKCRDPNFRKYFSVKEGILSLLVEYIFSLKYMLIYNKIVEFGEFIWK